MNRAPNEADAGRRRALRLLAAAGLIAAAPAGGAFAQSVTGLRASRLIDVVLPHARSARGLGRSYLMQEPADLPDLIEALEETLARTEPGLAPSQTGSALEQIVRREYASGETLLVEGWVLSRTECRLYALAALAL